MPALGIPPEAISASIFRAWVAGFAEPVRTIFPGMKHETSNWTEWYELWVDHWTIRPRRTHAPEFADLRVTAHVFVKGTTEKARVQELVVQAQNVLSGKSIPVFATPTTSEIAGYVKLWEAEIRELTRLDADASRHGLQHQVIRWNGLAQRTDSE